MNAAALAVGVAAAGAVAGFAAHALPSVSAITPLRRRFAPGLAGIGDPAHVALTFDDGPDARSTPLFLDLLAERGVTATFFLLGRAAATEPVLVKEMAAAGHELAIHGWDHRCLLARTTAATYEHLTRARETVAELTGVRPRWFRPPYGVLTTGALTAAAQAELRPVLWTTWGRDWEAAATPASVHRRVRSRLAGGGTVLLHDSDCTSSPGAWRSALGALPRILDDCEAAGWDVGPLRSHGS